MSDYIKKIRTTSGDKQIDYNALANLPGLATDKTDGFMPKEDKSNLTGLTGNIQSQLNAGFMPLGHQPVSSPTDDTTSTWLGKLRGYATYDTNGTLKHQPSRYGILLNYRTSTDIFQMWIAIVSGSIYYRIGNAIGWWGIAGGDGTWRKFYDDNNSLPVVTNEDNGKILKVVNGVWTAVDG
jgi:hypothetical protein